MSWTIIRKNKVWRLIRIIPDEDMMEFVDDKGFIMWLSKEALVNGENWKPNIEGWACP